MAKPPHNYGETPAQLQLLPRIFVAANSSFPQNIDFFNRFSTEKAKKQSPIFEGLKI